jgi:hypothetical protein
MGQSKNGRYSPTILTVHQVRIKSCIDGSWLDERRIGRDEEVIFVPFCFGSHFEQVEGCMEGLDGVEAER